jgi:periodic tryptophan protein 2
MSYFQTSQNSKLYYKRLARHYLRDAMPANNDVKSDVDDKEAQRLKYIKPDVTAADFNSVTHILVTGFSNGVFFIHELPEAQLIHSLSISEQSILSIALNPSGDWIAFGCEHLGQVTFIVHVLDLLPFPHQSISFHLSLSFGGVNPALIYLIFFCLTKIINMMKWLFLASRLGMAV